MFRYGELRGAMVLSQAIKVKNKSFYLKTVLIFLRLSENCDFLCNLQFYLKSPHIIIEFFFQWEHNIPLTSILILKDKWKMRKRGGKNVQGGERLDAPGGEGVLYFPNPKYSGHIVAKKTISPLF